MSKRICTLGIVLLLLLALVPATHGQDDRGQVFYDFGVFAFEDGEYEDAIENFKKALALDPDNPDYLHFLGKTYMEMGKLDDAERYLTEAYDLDPTVPGLKYDLALLHFKQKAYFRAAQLFQEIVEEEPNNVLAAYYGGISLFHHERYEEARTFLLDAAEKSPTLKASGYYYAGVCDVQTGDYKEAEKKFEYVKENATSDALRQNAVKWLDITRDRWKFAKPYRLFFKLGYQYDTNILLEPSTQDLPTNEEDYAVVGFFSGSYNLVNESQFKFGVGYNHYQVDYTNLQEFDLMGSIGSIYARYITKKASYGFTYLPTYYWQGRDDYLATHRLRPDIAWHMNDKTIMRIAYAYTARNYFQNPGRSGHTNNADLDVFYSFPNNKVQLFGGFGYESNSAQSLVEDYDLGIARLGVSFSLPLKLKGRVTGTLWRKIYENFDPRYGLQRKDWRFFGFVSLARPIVGDWLEIIGEYRYTRNDSNVVDPSNVEIFDWDRNQVTVSFAASF